MRVKQLQNRNAQSVIGAIPEWYFSQITIDSMYEHNSLILTGNPGVLEELELFIDEIDLTVPVVMIELIIVDIQEGRLREIGVEAGVSDSGSTRTSAYRRTSCSRIQSKCRPRAISLYLRLVF